MAGTQAIDRAAQLLVRIVESPTPIGVGELADGAELPKSTTSRLVGALERQGLLQRDGHRGRLRPGPVLLRFAHRNEPHAMLIELSAAALDRLADESGETVNLAVPTPLGVDQLAQRDSRHFIGSTNWVGRTVPYDLTANGKVFLAWGAATDGQVPQAKLERIRKSGYAFAVDQLEIGLSALAAPVFAANECVAAISISGPTIRLDRRRIERLAPALLEESRAVSARLGPDHDQEVAL